MVAYPGLGARRGIARLDATSESASSLADYLVVLTRALLLYTGIRTRPARSKP